MLPFTKGIKQKVWSKALGEHTVRELFLCIMATVATVMTMQDNDNRPTARYSFCFFYPCACPCGPCHAVDHFCPYMLVGQ